jgi:hypothetical protein
MTESLDLASAKLTYAPVLERLAGLSRTMLLAFRLEVGKLVLDEFFDGNARAFRDKNPAKEASFAAFAQACQEDLSKLGLSAALVRQCVHAWVAWEALPAQVREQLPYSHVVALAGVAEPTMRARLAMDTTREGWTVAQLRDAIDRAFAGRYYDTDPDTPGTQPPPDRLQPAKAPQPGRLVAQLEKAGKELQAWGDAWGTVDVRKLRGPQRERCTAALEALEAQVARLRAELAKPEA